MDYLEHYQNTLQEDFISWDLLRMEAALSGGTVLIPSGLSREDRRKWIF